MFPWLMSTESRSHYPKCFHHQETKNRIRRQYYSWWKDGNPATRRPNAPSKICSSKAFHARHCHSAECCRRGWEHSKTRLRPTKTSHRYDRPSGLQVSLERIPTFSPGLSATQQRLHDLSH